MEATNSIILGEDTGGKGRVFQSRFLQAGLVKYSFGVCLLTKETINKFVNSFIGCPVRIDHKDITDENAKDERVGVVSDIWFNDGDGWFWCKGVIFDDKAIDLIKNGYNVSCQYEITEYSDNIENKLHNGIPYDKEILNGKFEHLAIVDNPRYEGALIAVNALMASNDKWITVKPNGEENTGKHLLLKKGESPYDAIRRVYGDRNQKQLFDTSAYKKHKEDYKREREEEERRGQEAQEKHKQVVKEEKDKNIEAYINGEINSEELNKRHPDLSTKEWFDLADKKLKRQEDKKKKNDKTSNIPDDYKKSVEHYSKEQHENAADFYGEKMAGWQKKATANPDNEDYKAKFNEYKSLKDYHEKQVKKDRQEPQKKDEPAFEKENDIESFKQGKIKGYELREKYPEITIEELEKIQKEQKKEQRKINKEKKKIEKEKAKPKILEFIKLGKDTKTPTSVYTDLTPIEREVYEEINDERLIRRSLLEWDDFNYLKLTGKNPKRDTWKEATDYILKKYKATNEYKPILDYIENYDERNETMNEETKNVFERLISALKAKNEADDKDKKAENEDVDKRDIIRQIMAIAGKEEASEDVKTIAKLAEKLAYDKSEAGTADNKAKNEEKEKEKEADNCRAKNDKVDKRELIDQVGGILKGKVDDEIIRTVIGKLEEIAYDKSEAGTADNKAKNDDDEYKKLKDDVEKDVENCKAKNSMDALKELFYTGEVKQEKSYMSQKERIELGKQLF